MVTGTHGTPAERLERRLVVRDSGCIEWTGFTSRGYGQIRFNGAMSKTHRVAWELANGPIPDGLFVCHHCDNPPCCNVEHLWLGTNADNTADKVAKGRTFNGNTAKTHCPQGHPYDETNTYVTLEKGARHCRECIRARARARYVARPFKAVTHCPIGHPYDEANTYVKKNTGHRSCRACAKVRHALRYRKTIDDARGDVATEARRAGWRRASAKRRGTYRYTEGGE